MKLSSRIQNLSLEARERAEAAIVAMVSELEIRKPEPGDETVVQRVSAAHDDGLVWEVKTRVSVRLA